jgi:two-component system, NarL family, response regulator NreC
METNFTQIPNFSLLIVDDHALLREGLLLMFRIYQQATAIGVAFQEMPNAMEQYEPDVVIVGLGAKHSPSWAAIRALCIQRPDACLLILDETVRTGNIRIALSLGLRGYWTKHSTFSQIAEAAGRLAAGEHSFCPEVDRYLFRTQHGLYYHPAHTGSPLRMLTPREIDVLTLLAQGLTLKQCSQQLGIAVNTVDNHKTRLMRKLGLHKNVELARLAVREGLVEEG